MRSRRGSQLDAERLGHYCLELVDLVDDERIVLGEDLAAGRQVGAEEVEVDHDDVGLRCVGSGQLAEAAPALGAAEGAGALPRSDGHHGPGAI